MAGLFAAQPQKTPEFQLPTVVNGPQWGQGEGKQTLTPETASKSAASVIR